MRSRLLKPSFFDDEDLCKLPHGARLLFIALWCLADREGRLQDIPRRIAADSFPYENINDEVESWLEMLNGNWIKRYTSLGQKCIQINNFKKHQKVHPDEKKSTLPEPNENPIGIVLENRSEAEAEAEAEAVRAIPPGFDLSESAQRIHARHPYRRGALHEVERAITGQISDGVNPAALAADLERRHSAWCASEDWQKENHKFAPLLPRWIREGRCWEDPPKDTHAGGYRTVRPGDLT